ncbi:MAG: hypothetical protein RL380_471 [Verrucomicrobiota bacterium]|jgi:Holliday junction resolvase-like predicted endonuclease
MNSEDKFDRSSRHSKITGDFGEKLVLYWLSKHGYECAFVDHVGIDIIAWDKGKKRRLGISVKARSRLEKTKGTSLDFNRTHIEKLENACEDFDCEPYFALVIDEGDSVFVFILKSSQLQEQCNPNTKNISWKMGEKYLKKYKEIEGVKIIQLRAETRSWS